MLSTVRKSFPAHASFILFFSAVGFALAVPSATELSTQAASAYARQDWKTAITNYEELRERGIADPALLYNLGTAYAKAGDKGRAALMLLRALRLAPRDADIRANLQVVSPESLSQLAFFPVAPVEFVYGLLSLNEWALAALGMTILAAMGWILFFLLPRTQRLRMTLRRTGVFIALLAAILHGLAGAKFYQEAYTSRGVIIAAETHPREAPSDSSPAAEFILPPGTIIKVETAGVTGWVKAIYGGRNQVFIRREQMEFL